MGGAFFEALGPSWMDKGMGGNMVKFRLDLAVTRILDLLLFT